MAYTKTKWVADETPLSPGNLNKIEQGVEDAHTGISNMDTAKVSHSLATQAGMFLFAENIGAFVAKTVAQVKTLLGLGSAAYTESSAYASATHTQAFSTITGTVPVTQGGTGQTTLAAARNAMGLGNTTGALPVANGGTGAATAAAALTNLGITATAAEINIMDGVTGVTAAEISCLANVTSDIQTQLNGKVGLTTANSLTGTKPLSFNVWGDISANGNGQVLIGQNCYTSIADNTFRYTNTHSNLGAKGIIFMYPSGHPYYFDMGNIATVANAAFTPGFRRIETEATVVSVTASKTLALSDVGVMQFCNSASAIVLTIPTNAAVAFPLNTEIPIYRYGAGTVTIAAASGVSISSSGGKLNIKSTAEAACLKKVDTNLWVLVGSLS